MASLCSLAATLAVASAAKAQADEFQWLETPTDPGALAWARRQTAATKATLGAKPDCLPITAALRSVLKTSPPPPTYFLIGDKVLRVFRDADHPHGLLQVALRGRDGLPRNWRTVLDVASLKTEAGTPYELQLGEIREPCLAPRYERCLLRLSPGGGDAAELREIDLRDGSFPADGFRAPAGRLQFAWLGEAQILIATDAVPGTTTQAGWPADVRLWTRGSALASSPVIYKGAPTDAILMLSALGQEGERKGVINRVIDYSTFELSTVDRSGRVRAVDLPRRLKPFGSLAFTARHIVVQLTRPEEIAGRRYAPETVLAYDTRAATPDDKRVTPVFVPEPGTFVNDTNGGVVGTASTIHLVVDSHLAKHSVAVTLGAGGWSATPGEVAAPGRGIVFAGGDAAGEDILVTETGFLTPATISLQRPGRPRLKLYGERQVFDAAKLAVEVRSAKSADGTPVDYYLIRPKQPQAGPTPTLLTGYGAYGVSITPGYLDFWVGGPATALWFERGGAVAIAAIRGGGEKGEAWRRAALGSQRQRSYDDFIAVAESLVESRFTEPTRLGLFGSSNGGLLVATVAVQRPDLFGAVVSDAPFIDMLRFPKMGIGGAFKLEYGDPDDPAARGVILKYSPYQNIRRGETYPPIFTSVSTTDNRVGPGHARKFAARLQDVGATAYFYESNEGGHGVSDALQRPELIELRTTFLIDTLMRGAPPH